MQARQTKTIFEKFIPQIGVTPTAELLSTLFAEVAALFQVERVGFARMEAGHASIQQEVQFLLSQRKCETRELPRLLARDYPGYFKALLTPPGVIISHDVMQDERLRDFWQGYFKPLRISSMLDVPVHRTGQLYGVICHEQVGPKRQWTDEEVSAACSFSHIVALAIETGQRQKAEEELRQTLDREMEMVRMKTNFVNLVSHEFRTPLGVIVSAADILESYYDRLRIDQRAGHLRDIRESAQQMSGLMEEVLLLGKVESEKMSCRREPIDLQDFCRHVTDEQLSATNRKCPIELSVGVDPALALADESLLRHIFNNLLSNAVKYSPAGRQVQFNIRREGAMAEFEIVDQGIGIEPADQKHLFTAFYRGSNVGVTPGTGLGLVIVKRCVDLHEGTITFQTHPGEGTRFKVRLELFAIDKPKPSDSATKALRKPTQARKL